VVGLIVIGPKRLPETIRFLGYWVGKLRRSVQGARQDMEREFGLDEIRRELYNEELLGRMEEERKQIERRLGSPSLTPADQATPANLKIPNEEDFIDDGPSEPLPLEEASTDKAPANAQPSAAQSTETTATNAPHDAALEPSPATSSEAATNTSADKAR